MHTAKQSFNSAEIFLGRQPILNVQQKPIAYELLFRTQDKPIDGEIDDLVATSTVIVNMLSQFGLGQVLGKLDGFLNVSASLLMCETLELLPAERIVIEILEDVPINGQILARCQALKARGFRLAIDGFHYRAEYLPLLPLVDFVKIDLSTTPMIKVPNLVTIVRKVSQAKLIAEKVEQAELFEQCKQLGFDAFQGYFFAKPNLLKAKKPQPHHMTLMRMMGILLADADLSELEMLFKNNPSLTLGMLTLVNSVGVSGGRQKVESIRQAIVVLGQKQLMRWVQLLLYASPDGQMGGALMLQAANRARTMELLAQKIQIDANQFSDQAFMVGMLSLADAIMQMPLEAVLDEIGLSDALRSAILHQAGVHGQLLTLVKAIESGDFSRYQQEIHQLNINADDLLEIQLASMQWAEQLAA